MLLSVDQHRLRLGPAQQAQPAAEVLDQRRAALDPVAVVAVGDAVDLGDLRAVDVAADHAVDLRRRASAASVFSKLAMYCTAFLTLCFRNAASDQYG